MSKLKYMVLMLLVVTIIYGAVLYHNLKVYEQRKKEAIEQRPEWLRPYITYGPFSDSEYGRYLVSPLVALTFAWICVGGYLATTKNKPVKGAILVSVTFIFFAVTFIKIGMASEKLL